MTVFELTVRVAEAKKYLNDEIVRIKTTTKASPQNYREIGDRLDMIHEIERIGIRNLNSDQMRRVSRMLSQVDAMKDSQN